MNRLVYPTIIVFLIILFGVSYCQQQKRTRQVLSENERLVNENRGLKKNLELSSLTAQQIADRKDIQHRVEGNFVDQREYYRRNWQQFIAVSNSDYRTGLLGGIKDLKIIVRNQSDYPLDNVVVAVEYMRSNGDVFKTEQYTINNIPSKGTQSVTASNSRKGMKVKLKLISITSQAMNFCWAYNKPAPAGNPDPYQCAAK
jgi:hypothetical protein